MSTVSLSRRLDKVFRTGFSCPHSSKFSWLVRNSFILILKRPAYLHKAWSTECSAASCCVLTLRMRLSSVFGVMVRLETTVLFANTVLVLWTWKAPLEDMVAQTTVAQTTVATVGLIEYLCGSCGGCWVAVDCSAVVQDQQQQHLPFLKLNLPRLRWHSTRKTTRFKPGLLLTRKTTRFKPGLLFLNWHQTADPRQNRNSSFERRCTTQWTSSCLVLVITAQRNFHLASQQPHRGFYTTDATVLTQLFYETYIHRGCFECILTHATYALLVLNWTEIGV